MRPLFLVCLLTSTAAAQIVNVQPLVAKREMRPGFGLAIEAALDWRTGNVELLLGSGNLIARYRNGRHHVFLLGHGEIGIKSGARFIAKDLEHLRYRAHVVGPLDLEAFVQHETDQFRRIALRMVWGGGPRLRIIMTHRYETAIAAAYLGEYEEIRQDDKPDAGSTRLMHRVSLYTTMVIRLNTHFSLAETVYLQPRIGEPRDLKLLEDVELLSSVTNHLSIKLGWSLSYDNVPPIGIKPLDTGMRAMLQLSW